MKDKFYIQIAGLCIEMNASYDHARKFCGDFIIDKPEKCADIIADTTSDELKREMENAEKGATESYAEIICLYRHIAEQLPKFNCFVFHGAAISYNNKGYLFTAPSGTGKSTHIKLWRRHLGNAVDIINGDKPVLKVTPNGVDICSTPWAGKENWRKNVIYPLESVCLLARGTDNKITRFSPSQSVTRIMHQVYIPKNGAALGLTMELIDAMLRNIPVYSLECDISENAVKTAFSAMTGKEYIQNTN